MKLHHNLFKFTRKVMSVYLINRLNTLIKRLNTLINRLNTLINRLNALIDNTLINNIETLSKIFDSKQIFNLI